MSEFSLDDALSGQANAGNLQSGQGTQGQNWNNPWGGQNPGQPGGFPGQPYPGFAGPGGPGQGQGGQQYPGFSGPGQGGQQYPGFSGPGQGGQYPGAPAGGPQYPGFPAGGQQYPGGYPGFPGPGQSYPGAPTAPGQPAPSAPPAPSGPQKVPFDLPLPGGCVKGMCFEMEAIPNGKRFTIDYRIGPDIALHFNPRFDEHPNVVVRNSFIGGKWGHEERPCTKFPFKQSQPFKMQILFDPEGYRVAVNNENLCQYKHRITNFAGINSIRVDGAVQINNARITMV